MRCPNCKSQIIDSAIICPVCNTQFAFNGPSTFNPQDTNIYEKVDTLEEVEVTPNSVTNLPTEVSHSVEEELDPSNISYVAVPESKEEFMHINGQPISMDNTPYNPMETFSNVPLKQETPRINVASTVSDNGGQSVSYSEQSVSNVNSVVPNSSVAVPAIDSDNVVNSSQTDGVVTSNINANSQISGENSNPALSAPIAVSSENYLKEMESLRKKSDVFFKIVIVGGVFIIGIILIIMLGEDNKRVGRDFTTKQTTTLPPLAQSNNVGHKSTFNYPLYVGSTTIAAVFDSQNNIWTDVDVKGERFISGVEATELAKAYTTQVLNQGFEWHAFEYTVTFNDLVYLNEGAINPVLKTTIYKWNGFDFIVYNGKNYFLDVVSIYSGGNITNNSSAKIKVLYQLPVGEKEYSVCFGDFSKTLGCFTPSIN